MKQKDLIGLSRSPLINQLHAIKASVTQSVPRYNMHGLIKQNVLQWLWKNLLHLGNTHYTYQTYHDPATNNGIFKMPDIPGMEVSVALLSDWASDTPESHNVAELCGSIQRDFTIHLGDTYYVGNEKEIACNFNSTFGAPWPYGKTGSFALLGNHEMYSSGKTYFTHLLPYMTVVENNEVKQQEASFFCLENQHWRIIGIDTGYYSLKGFLGVKANTDLKLHDEHLKWLRDIIQFEKDNRGIILLSHHQAFSAFDKEEYPNPAQQLSEMLGGRTVLWFWGHEHRLSLYGENELNNGMKVFARCIGHGGMPVDIEEQPGQHKSLHNLTLYDKRERTKIDGKYSVGYNGYVILKFNGPELTIEYYDGSEQETLQRERKILEEKWSVTNGVLSGLSITDLTKDSEKKLTHLEGELNIAISKRQGASSSTV